MNKGYFIIVANIWNNITKKISKPSNNKAWINIVHAEKSLLHVEKLTASNKGKIYQLLQKYAWIIKSFTKSFILAKALFQGKKYMLHLTDTNKI